MNCFHTFASYRHCPACGTRLAHLMFCPCGWQRPRCQLCGLPGTPCPRKHLRKEQH